MNDPTLRDFTFLDSEPLPELKEADIPEIEELEPKIATASETSYLDGFIGGLR